MLSRFFFRTSLLFFAALWNCQVTETPPKLPDIEFENQLGNKLVDCLCADSDLSIRPWRPSFSAAYRWTSARLEGFTHPVKGLLHLKGRSLMLWEIDDAHHFGAYLLPGGHILVGRGLIDCLSSASEAEALLVHLLAHAALHHPMQLLLKDYPLSQLEAVARTDRKRLCLSMALSSLFYSYSERLEAQADSLAGAWGLFCDAEAALRARLLDHCAAESSDEDQYPVAVLHPALSNN
jgi:hypothetical protein